MDDWLSDFDRVRKASPLAQVEAVGELDKALRPLEENPTDYGVTRIEAEKQRADLEAFKLTLRHHHSLESSTDNTPSFPSADPYDEDDLGYQLRDERQLQIGLLDHLVHVDDDDDRLRSRFLFVYPEPGEFGLYLTIFLLAVVIVVLLIYLKS